MISRHSKINLDAIQVMEKLLVAFRQDEISIHQLVAKLDATLNGMMISPDPEWKGQFMIQWRILEEVNAVELAAEEGMMVADSVGNQQLVDEASLKLLDIVRKARSVLEKDLEHLSEPPAEP